MDLNSLFKAASSSPDPDKEKAVKKKEKREAKKEVDTLESMIKAVKKTKTTAEKNGTWKTQTIIPVEDVEYVPGLGRYKWDEPVGGAIATGRKYVLTYYPAKGEEFRKFAVWPQPWQAEVKDDPKTGVVTIIWYDR